MKIALDFDDTYTAMPDIWDQFIESCKEQGHEVTIVTARANSEVSSYNHDIRLVCKKHDIEVVYTDGKAKALYYSADIWIDDHPEWVPSKSMMEAMVRLG